MRINPPPSAIARNGTRLGLTHVELLVSITIVLAALVFAVTGKTRGCAKQANAVLIQTAGDNRRAIYFFPNRKGIFCLVDDHVEMLSAPVEDRRLGFRTAGL